MLEYVFFDQRLRDRLVEFIRERGGEAHAGEDEPPMAMVSEDLDDELAEAVDEYYERLLQENADLVEAAEGDLAKTAAGVRVQLSDGTPCQVVLDPEMMSRVLNCLSLEELRDFVQDVARAVENPEDKPICQMID